MSGDSVTASAPSESYADAAYADAVEPTSPRFASSSTGMPSGTHATTLRRVPCPNLGPIASKKAAFGL
jgi:hypothetical protein